jgi:hypothetical protein
LQRSFQPQENFILYKNLNIQKKEREKNCLGNILKFFEIEKSAGKNHE